MPDTWPMTQEELDAWYQWILPWMELYGGFLKFGLQLFEPEGEFIDPETGFILGSKYLINLRTHFEERKACGRAERVHSFMEEPCPQA